MPTRCARTVVHQTALPHPVSGVVLDLDRTAYRVPADLTNWVQRRDQMTQDAATGITWTSPTGATRGADSPPF